MESQAAAAELRRRSKRLRVVSNAVTYSPETDNDCHKAAKANLSAFETAFLKEGLATDGGAAAEAAKEGIKRASVTRKRGRE